MTRGGRRPGAGRLKGARDRFFRKAREKVRAVQEAELFFTTTGDGPETSIFDGDGLTLLRAVYRDERLPLPIRLNAAKLGGTV